MSSSQWSSQWENLLMAMREPAFYPHPTHQIRLIQTHISAIFLTGEFAYKLKKPVNFGFLDFSSLEKRKHYCEEELRLNRCFAPQLYLSVEAILQEGKRFRLAEFSTLAEQTAGIVDYVVKMRQFDPADQLDQRLAAGTLTLSQMDSLALQLAEAHQKAQIAPQTSLFGRPEKVLEPALENISQLRQHLPYELLERLNTLESWTHQTYARLYPLFKYRHSGGHIRACHGDLHLANITLINNQITFFDGIEFNESLRWIDTASDIAFLLMDLQDRAYPVFARRLLNQYLSASGDYEALGVLSFYQVYRALVRAKVQALRLVQVSDTESQQRILKECAAYLALAERYTQPHPPALVITHGMSGSGKSFAARELADQFGFIQLRADVERKRLVDMQPTQRDTTGLNQGIYSAAMSERTYQRLAELTAFALQQGQRVLVDATFLQAKHRQRFQAIASAQDIKFLILSFQASPEQLAANIQKRQQQDTDASDADLAVLHQQLSHYQAPQAHEPVVSIQFAEALPIAKIEEILNLI